MDADEIGRIQAVTWHQAYERQLPASALEAMTADAAADSWRAGVAAPPDSGHKVMVALEVSATETTRVGFVAIAPAGADEEDIEAPTAEIVMLLVEPRWGRRGHGARLLTSAVETARAGGAERMICWVLAGDKATESFLRSAGWERDGWRRSFDAGEREIAQHRLHTDISHLPTGSRNV
jgi:GNAT superfamily N-acetyltransferase